MISGQTVTILPDDLLKRIEEFMRAEARSQGPGCCMFYAASPQSGGGETLYQINGIADLADCYRLAEHFRGSFECYIPGQNCGQSPATSLG